MIGALPLATGPLAALPESAGPSIVEGEGTATGAASVSGIGASVAQVASSATGEAVVSGASAAVALCDISTSGMAHASGDGAGIGQATSAATSAATASGAGASVVQAAGSASGTASVSGASAVVIEASGTATGAAAVSFTSASLAAAVGAASGLAAASGASGALFATSGAAAGAATVSGQGAFTTSRPGPGVALSHLYTLLCRDSETAVGGITPASSDYHVPYFSRARGNRLDDLPGDGIDRIIEVKYTGTENWPALGNMQNVGGLIRVGYFAGEHKDHTYSIMQADEHLIGRSVNYQGNWLGAAMIARPGDITDVGEDRFIMEIPVTIQID